MAGWTVRAPQGDYTGTSCGVVFEQGVGYAAELAPGALAYFRQTGYEVTQGGKGPERVPASVHPDGGPGGRAPASRDAAVLGKQAAGPNSDAYLPPVGAGQGLDPHGPEVVAPGLHGVPPGPILPGAVAPRGDLDPADPEHTEQVEAEQAEALETQERRETDAAQRILAGDDPNDAAALVLPEGASLPRKKEELAALAEQLGLDPSGTASELRERIKARTEA
jgi:hypothetical protein